MHAEAASRCAAVPAALCAAGIAVCDGFLTPREVRALIECARMRRERGDFAPARVGADPQRRAEIRGDAICWLSEPLIAPERAVLGLLEELRLQLNREATLGLFDLELHYAWYPPGAAYVRHTDRPRGRDQRRLSIALYLNEAWKPPHGGELRYFEEGGAYRDIEPRGGRLVAFLSESREHAVLTTRAARLSLTGWFGSREELRQ
jgi:SM-20-related protein